MLKGARIESPTLRANNRRTHAPPSLTPALGCYRLLSVDELLLNCTDVNDVNPHTSTASTKKDSVLARQPFPNVVDGRECPFSKSASSHNPNLPPPKPDASAGVSERTAGRREDGRSAPVQPSSATRNSESTPVHVNARNVGAHVMRKV